MAKWIEFEDAGTTPSGKTRVWWVVSKENRGTIGQVRWDARWRKYVFAPTGGTIYEQQCLRDIATFIEEKTCEHKVKQ